MTSISEPFTVFESDASKSHVKLGEWMLVESLGSGTFGKVKLGVHERTGAKVAVKILNRDVIKALDVVGKIRREIQNLSLFRHPHIIRLHSVTSTPTDIFMIMEYVSGGELFDHIVKKGKLNSTEARRFFQQIISGVHYCHLHKVVHRDLKPENLLLDEDLNVKIADFGLSNLMTDGDFMRTSCGSPNYAAPEVINGHLYCGPEVDVWSCGVILYALLCGTLPFDDEHVPTLFKKIKSGIFHIPSHVHRDAANLLRRMLEVDPAKRATMQEIINHPWFQVDLPGYLFPPANETPNIVDMVAVRDVVARYDVAEEDVTSALLSEIPDHPLAVAYNLIVDNKRAVNEGMRLDDFLNARMPETPKTIRGSSRFENHDNNMVTPPTDTGKKKSRWHLGIRSSCKPREIMMQVFKALKKLNFEWRVVDAYRLVVRKRFVASTPPRKPKDMPCITLQLYQVRTDHFLLDFKYIVEEKKPELLPSIPSGRRYSYSTSVLENDVICDEADVFPTVFEEPLEDDVVADEPELPPPPTMLFFEMCVELINALAHR